MGKEKPAPSAATLERAGAEKAAGNTSIPVWHFNTEGQNCQITKLLNVGKANGIKLPELSAMIGRDERSTRRQIQMERKSGAVIITDCENGYFLPESPDDILRFIRQMRNRAKEIHQISVLAEDALLRETGQERMKGW